MRSRAPSDVVLSDALRAFKDYVGLKLHFNSDFIFRRDMQLNRINETALMKRKDAFMFYSLVERTEDRETRLQMLISGFRMNPKLWIGEIDDQELKAFHKNRMRIMGALKYSFRTDVDRIVRFMEEENITAKKLFKTDGKQPLLIACLDQIDGGVTDETLSLLDKGFKFTNQTDDDPFWQERKLSISKYHHWIDVEGEFLKQQLSRVLEANR